MQSELIGLDPLFLTNAKLFIKDIHSLETIENVSGELYYLYDHIIKLVEICGVIVGVEQRHSYINYIVDDNSGTIACCFWRSEVAYNHTTFQLGDLVRVYGKIETVEGNRRITTNEIFALDNPNEELAHSMKTLFLDSEYKKPYKIPEVIEDKKKLLIAEITPEVTEIQHATDEELFTQAVYQFLKENSKNTAFMLSLLTRNDKLIAMAKEVILKNQPEEPSKNQITRLFEETINNLSNRRLVVESVNKPGMFELVDEHAVENFILQIMLDILRKPNAIGAGIRLEYIKFRVTREFRDLEIKSFEKIMDDLVTKGAIHLVDEKTYGVTI